MKKAVIIIMMIFFLAGCAQPDSEDSEELSYYPESCRQYAEESAYVPLNYTKQVGIWLPYMRFDELLKGKSEDEYRSSIAAFLDDSAAQGVNTVYYHAHPNGDAYYVSELFPRGESFDGGYDPLEIFLDEAHQRGISVHGWLNPLRCQTEAQMESIPDSFITKQWTKQPEKGYIKLVGDRWYLVPNHEEVRKLICDAADELLTKYELDGIHIDDYFYPTTDEDFDRAEFEASGSSDLAQWRRDIVSTYVKSLYETVKTHGSHIRFGISPQGNITSDREKQFADVELWSKGGYCDYIVPQIYYGFKNECCPFERTLREWEALTADGKVSLVAGLAAYKVGKDDKWAGESGIDEWIDDPDIITKQIKLVQSSSADGYALYY